jgi:cytoskeleton protein RodZ
MTIGSELRQAREQRGLSLVQISERTKVRLAMLRAIESDDFQQLPGGVISRGFLKLYAREVGLDANEIVTRYRSEIASGQLEHSEDGDAAGDGTPGHSAAAKTGSSVPRAAALVLALVALLAISYFAMRPSPARSGADAGSELDAEGGAAAAQSPAASKAVDAASPPGATSGAGAAQPAGTASSRPAVQAEALRVDLEATAACWISATVDGNQVAYRALNPGERLALRAANEVVLRIGIPANLTVSINDQPVPPFERPGTPVTLRITPENYRDLLAR